MAVELWPLVILTRLDGDRPQLTRNAAGLSAEKEVQVQSGVSELGSLSGRPQTSQQELEPNLSMAAHMACGADAEEEHEDENETWCEEEFDVAGNHMGEGLEDTAAHL